MKIYNHIDEIKPPPPASTALALGCFDGVHIGHRLILSKVLERKGAGCSATGLITFDPCPALVFGANGDRCLITTTDEKLDILEHLGLDWVLVIRFDEEFMKISAEDFVADILMERLGAGVVVAGHDVGFGYKRRGNASLLRTEAKRHGFKVQILEPVRAGGEIVSSTATRARIKAGDLAGAAAMLGRPYALSGAVVPGDRLGRSIGVPTANIDVPPYKILPPNGVYSVRARFDGASFHGVMSIGNRPTVTKKGALTVEVHLLDFHAGIYGKILSVEPVSFVREQQKFDSLDELKNRIHSDIETARRILDNTLPQ